MSYVIGGLTLFLELKQLFTSVMAWNKSHVGILFAYRASLSSVRTMSSMLHWTWRYGYRFFVNRIVYG